MTTGQTNEYAVIVDAGSSGSRVHVYCWKKNNDDPAKEGKDIRYPDYWSPYRIDGGIQKIAPILENLRDSQLPVHISDQIAVHQSLRTIKEDTKTEVNKHLKPLLDHALNYIPSDQVKETPLFVLATGGMRRHKLEHFEEYLILRDAICQYIKEYEFKKPTYRTISGEDEALYGWVAANLTKGAGMKCDTRGFVEMGGESVQLSVSLNKEERLNYKGPLWIVKIWGEKYYLFVKTWMGLGIQSAWNRREARFRESDSVIVVDPCTPKGYSYRLRRSDKIVQGSGNFRQCFKECISLLKCNNENCAAGNFCVLGKSGGNGCLLRGRDTDEDHEYDHFGDVAAPIFKKEKFQGASVYYHATHGIFQSDESEGPSDNFSELWDAVGKFCDNDWDTMKQKKRETPHVHLRKAIFTTGMVMSTLFLGFGIPMPAEAEEAVREIAVERADLVVCELEERKKKAEKTCIQALRELPYNLLRDKRSAGAACQTKTPHEGNVTPEELSQIQESEKVDIGKVKGLLALFQKTVTDESTYVTLTQTIFKYDFPHAAPDLVAKGSDPANPSTYLLDTLSVSFRRLEFKYTSPGKSSTLSYEKVSQAYKRALLAVQMLEALVPARKTAKEVRQSHKKELAGAKSRADQAQKKKLADEAGSKSETTTPGDGDDKDSDKSDKNSDKNDEDSDKSDKDLDKNDKDFKSFDTEWTLGAVVLTIGNHEADIQTKNAWSELPPNQQDELPPNQREEPNLNQGGDS